MSADKGFFLPQDVHSKIVKLLHEYIDAEARLENCHDARHRAECGDGLLEYSDTAYSLLSVGYTVFWSGFCASSRTIGDRTMIWHMLSQNVAALQE